MKFEPVSRNSPRYSWLYRHICLRSRTFCADHWRRRPVFTYCIRPWSRQGRRAASNFLPIPGKRPFHSPFSPPSPKARALALAFPRFPAPRSSARPDLRVQYTRRRRGLPPLPSGRQSPSARPVDITGLYWYTNTRLSL